MLLRLRPRGVYGKPANFSEGGLGVVWYRANVAFRNGMQNGCNYWEKPLLGSQQR